MYTNQTRITIITKVVLNFGMERVPYVQEPCEPCSSGTCGLHVRMQNGRWMRGAAGSKHLPTAHPAALVTRASPLFSAHRPDLRPSPLQNPPFLDQTTLPSPLLLRHLRPSRTFPRPPMATCSWAATTAAAAPPRPPARCRSRVAALRRTAAASAAAAASCVLAEAPKGLKVGAS